MDIFRPAPDNGHRVKMQKLITRQYNRGNPEVICRLRTQE